MEIPFSSIAKPTVRSNDSHFDYSSIFYPYSYSLSMAQRVRTHETRDFNFAVAGDFGCGQEARKTIEAIKSKQPELVIALGDLAYKKNPQCWLEIILLFLYDLVKGANFANSF